MEESKKKCYNKCPFCGSKLIEPDEIKGVVNSEDWTDFSEYMFCNNCGKSFRQIFERKYTYTLYDKECPTEFEPAYFGLLTEEVMDWSAIKHKDDPRNLH